MADNVDRVSGDAKGRDGATEEKNVEGGGVFDQASDAAKISEGGGEDGRGVVVIDQGGGRGGQDGLSSRESSSKGRAGRSQGFLHDGADEDGADRPWTSDSNSAVGTEEGDHPEGYGDIDEYKPQDNVSDDEQVRR